jgi:hypothetical protein
MADYVVGQLYEPKNRPYPPAQQPGGIGTPVVDPTQPPVIYTNPPYVAGTNPTAWNERATNYTAGCNHCFMCWELIQVAISGTPMMLICCPLCGYIQSILTVEEALDVNKNPQIYG